MLLVLGAGAAYLVYWYLTKKRSRKDERVEGQEHDEGHAGDEYPPRADNPETPVGFDSAVPPPASTATAGATARSSEPAEKDRRYGGRT